jgi:phage gp45-like
MTYLFSNTISGNVSIYNSNGDAITLAKPLPVTLGSNTITITGNVNVSTVVQVNSTPENPVHTHLSEVGNSGILAVPYMPISGNVAIYNSNGTSISLSNRLPVAASITNTVTVIVDENAGNTFAFNNHATNTNRGWTMDDTMRPVVSFRVTDSGTTIADLIKILEYEIGNNNANQSTIVYEWYEGQLSFTGASIPSWTNLGTKIQYRVYQDRYSSNQGNAFTVNGSALRHSGIIIGKNTQGDEGPATLYGGTTPNMLTLCMRRVDNATKLDVWFAFTIKELV